MLSKWLADIPETGYQVASSVGQDLRVQILPWAAISRLCWPIAPHSGRLGSLELAVVQPMHSATDYGALAAWRCCQELHSLQSAANN